MQEIKARFQEAWSSSEMEVDARIANGIRISVGKGLRKIYDDVLSEPVPPRIATLLERLN